MHARLRAIARTFLTGALTVALVGCLGGDPSGIAPLPSPVDDDPIGSGGGEYEGPAEDRQSAGTGGSFEGEPSPDPAAGATDLDTTHEPDVMEPDADVPGADAGADAQAETIGADSD